MSAQARVYLCGPMRIELDGERVEGSLPGRQGRLLFAYLLLERDRWVSREELADLLWPEQPPPSAAVTLRALLSKLRAVLGREAVLGTSGLRVDLGADSWIDVEAAVSAAQRCDRATAEGAWREAWSAGQVALSIASRRFLPGEQSEWIEDKRRELEDLRLVALERLGRVALELGGSELVAAERCARAIVEAAPYRESGYLLLMRALAARGDAAEAIRVYDGARTRLRDELGIPPAPELRDLNERLARSEAGVTHHASTPVQRAGVGLPPLLAAVERTPMIGRTHSLERLNMRFEATQSSGPVVVTLTGEAGIGKTRLIRELAHVIHDRNAAVLYGSSPRDPSPYQPFVDALRQFISQAPPDDLARLRTIDPPVLARLLPELHEQAGSRAAEVAAQEETGRLRVFAGVTRMVEEITLAHEAPLLVALDDMHWADPASVQLLAHLLRSARSVPLLVLVAYRSREAPPMLAEALDQAQRRAPIERIDLSPLTEGDVETLISAWAGTGAPTSFAHDLHGRSDGNPLLIGHLLRHLVRAGAIDPDLRRWASGQNITALGVPHEVRELIELRLASFDHRTRQVLNMAAVVGQEFTFAVIEHALANSSDSALDALDAALGAGLVSEGARPGAFRFTHALIREAIYSGLSGVRRGRLHRAVGEAIRTVHAKDLSPHRAELAQHFLAAARAGEDPGPAIEASLAAAEQARRLFANEQAEAHYHAALELLDHTADPELRLEAWEGLGDMLAVRAGYKEAIDAYLEAMGCARETQALVRARLERKIGKAHMRTHAAEAAGDAFERAGRELEPVRDSSAAIPEIVEVGLERLTLCYWQNETVAMDELIERIRPVVDVHGTASHRVRLLHSVLAREARRQRYSLSQDTVEFAADALAAAEVTGDPTLLSSAQFMLGFSLLLAAAPAEALDYLQQVVALSIQTGDVMLEARALAYVSLAYRRLLRPEDADRAARRAFDAATAANTPEYQAIARANLAWVAACRGKTKAAGEHAQFALAYFGEIPSVPDFWPPLALWPLIAVSVSDDDIAAATAYAQQLLDPQRRSVSDSVERLLRGAIAKYVRDPHQAAEHLRRALQVGDGIALKSGTVHSFSADYGS